MKRALVCGAGGFIGGHPENCGLRIADWKRLRCLRVKIGGYVHESICQPGDSCGEDKSEILIPKSEIERGSRWPIWYGR